MTATQDINGMIRYFNLQDWWLSEFNDAERQRLIETYGDRLIKGNVSASSQTMEGFLKALASFWKPSDEDKYISKKIIDKSNKIKKD